MPTLAPRRTALLAVAILAVFLAGCGRTDSGRHSSNPGWFEDVSATLELQFEHEVETSGNHRFPESMGSGAAFLDFDGDGRLDIYLINNVNPSATAKNRLFHQQSNGRFRDVSLGSGLDIVGYGNGLAAGDVTNDGLPDLLVTEYDKIRLLQNLGTGKFKDVTSSAGLTNASWSIPAAFLDYDRDGWLDLVLGNYLDYDPSQRCTDAKGLSDFCGPHGFLPTITRLFRNLGTGSSESGSPRFEEVTIVSGLARTPGKAMQIVCADFDGDHWPDIFVTDDGLPNRLFINQRNGRFREEAVLRGVAYTAMGIAAANMGVALGDVDNDGHFDLFVPHLEEENHTFWHQGRRGVFRDETAAVGLLGGGWHGTGFGTVFGDFENDGWLDLVVVNGAIRRKPGKLSVRVMQGIDPFWAPYAEPPQLFANLGDGRFQEISAQNPAICGTSIVGRGLACGDFDNDGGLDLLVTGISGPAKLYRSAARRGHWLGLRLIDPNLGGRDAYGAEVTVRAGARQWWRLVHPAHSYASSNDPRVHVGLGTVTGVDSVRVVWPDGHYEMFPGPPIDGYSVLRKGAGTRSNDEEARELR